MGELSSAIDATVSTFSLKAGQGIKFPASDFAFKSESEWMHAASRSTDIFNSVTRGYDGSTATTHAANAIVFQTSGKSIWQRLYDNISSHQHPKAEISDFSHNHAQGDITNLVSDLAGKASSTHPHGEYQLSSQISSAAFTASSVYSISSHTHLGGSDPWNYVFLTSHFFTTSNALKDVPGMFFTPVTSTRYEIEGTFLMRTSTASVGPRPAILWPNGIIDGAATIRIASAAGSEVQQHGTAGSTVIAPVGGLPTTVSSWPARIQAYMIAGSSAASTFRIGLASETNASSVSMRTSSFFRWRTF